MLRTLLYSNLYLFRLGHPIVDSGKPLPWLLSGKV